ncbi:hypothetical protein APHAL10511_001945 [Amanita phalloides]|nr:hypothetical protein APHAL10511_001945 [Amanita phalloides]
MYSRPDSPPPRQPSPDLVPMPLSSPPHHLRGRVSSMKPFPSKLTTSRSYDGLELLPGGRFLAQSRSFENIRLRAALQSSIQEDEPELPSTTEKTYHISFRCPRPGTAVAPPVPALPPYLRMYHDDSESSDTLSYDSLLSFTGKESIRRCKSPPPPSKRRLAPLMRIKSFCSRCRSQVAAF